MSENSRKDGQKARFEAYKRKKRRENRHRAYALLLFFLVLTLFVFVMLFRIMGRQRPRPRFMFLTEEKLSSELETTALLIRDESVYNAPIDGLFRSFVPQGGRVAKQMKLGQILPPGKEDQLRLIEKAENDVNDRRYELLEEGKGGDATRVFEASREAIRRNLRIYYDDLLKGSTARAPEIEAEIRLTLEQRLDDINNYEFQDPELSSLIAYRENLEKGLNGEVQTIFSENSGLFMRRLDGLENDLTPDMALSISEEETRNFLKRAGEARAVDETVEAGKPFYKLCRSIEQYCVMILPRGKVSSEDENTRLRLSCPANGVDLKDARIIRVEEARGGTLVVCSSRQNLEAFSSMRKAPLLVHLHESRGLRVPKTALINYREGNVEAEIKLISGGYVHKTAVKIIEDNARYALIEGLENGEYPVEVSTMILLNPQSMEEGEPIVISN